MPIRLYAYVSSIPAVLLIPLLWLSPVRLAAQEKQVVINGKVTSFEESLPLEGVSIVVKGTHKETGTQSDGSFTLPVVLPADKILVVRFPGYETQEIKITQATQYDIVLKAVASLCLFPGHRCCTCFPSVTLSSLR